MNVLTPVLHAMTVSTPVLHVMTVLTPVLHVTTILTPVLNVMTVSSPVPHVMAVLTLALHLIFIHCPVVILSFESIYSLSTNPEATIKVTPGLTPSRFPSDTIHHRYYLCHQYRLLILFQST